jgi:hypothetical protein
MAAVTDFTTGERVIYEPVGRSQEEVTFIKYKGRFGRKTQAWIIHDSDKEKSYCFSRSLRKLQARRASTAARGQATATSTPTTITIDKSELDAALKRVDELESDVEQLQSKVKDLKEQLRSLKIN